MQERIDVLKHHITLCLEPFLENIDVSNIKNVLIKELFSRLEKDNIEGDLVYPFLSDAKQRERFLEAFTKAGKAFVANNYSVIPDEDGNGKQNADIICFACGNFQNNQCLASQEPEQ